MGMFVSLMFMDNMVSFIILIVLGLVAFIVWIYSIVDASTQVKYYNAKLLEDGQPPW